MVLVALGLLTACGGAAAPAAPGSAAAKPSVAGASASSQAAASQTTLTVGLSQVVGQFLPAWVAKDAGIYAKHGLDVDQRTATATATTASLLSGELQAAVTGGPRS